jgi:hypothetical protein
MSCSNGSIVICPITLTENPDRDPRVVDATNLQVISKTKARAKAWIAAEITSNMPIQELADQLLTSTALKALLWRQVLASTMLCSRSCGAR